MARIWNKESLGYLETCAALLATVGSMMIGLHAGQELVAPVLPLLVNCLTPLVLALCISTLRSGAKELFRPDNPLRGSMSPAEFTSLKMFLSSFTALLLSFVLESGTISTDHSEAPREAWWVALQHEQVAGIGFLLLGGVFVLIFQVNITWLSGLTSAVTVGVVGGVKVVPQWFLNAAFQGPSVDVSPLNMAGAALVLVASTLYAVSISSPYTLTLRPSGFEWQLRDDVNDDYVALGDKTTPVHKVLTQGSIGNLPLPVPRMTSLLTAGAELEVSLLIHREDSESQRAG